MIIEKLIELHKIPSYTLDGWELKGNPIITLANYQYNGTELSQVNNKIMQPIIRYVDINKSNESIIKKLLIDLWNNMSFREEFYEVYHRLKREKNIKNITYTTNEYSQLREDDIQIEWKEDNTYNSFYDNDFYPFDINKINDIDDFKVYIDTIKCPFCGYDTKLPANSPLFISLQKDFICPKCNKIIIQHSPITTYCLDDEKIIKELGLKNE